MLAVHQDTELDRLIDAIKRKYLPNDDILGRHVLLANRSQGPGRNRSARRTIPAQEMERLARLSVERLLADGTPQLTTVRSHGYTLSEASRILARFRYAPWFRSKQHLHAAPPKPISLVEYNTRYKNR